MHIKIHGQPAACKAFVMVSANLSAGVPYGTLPTLPEDYKTMEKYCQGAGFLVIL